jgi:hypothetical protein
MTSSISTISATEHVAELRRVAERRRSLPTTPATSAPAVSLRLARADEDRVLRRLAALDDAPALEGPALLALIDGEAVAALSLGDGRVVANPFVRTDSVVSLLRLRAGKPSRRRARRRWPTILRPRFA